MLSRKSSLIAAILAAPFFSPLHAAAQDDSDLAALMEILEQQTKIATKTGLNKDYVPGLVTIFDGYELGKRGMRTLGQALDLVPGIDLMHDETGNAQPVVRGIARTFASSNVKLMLNGVALNSASTSGAAALFEMPITQVDRIEVIRGPGSAIHGEFALMGVVNVITHRLDSRVTTEIDDERQLTAGGVHHWQSEAGDWQFALNAALTNAPGGDIEAGSDALKAIGTPQFSNAPGNANTRARYRSLLFSGDGGNHGFIAQFVESAKGDHFGINDYLPPSQRLVSTNSWYNLQGKRRFSFDDDHGAEIRAGWLRWDLDTDERFVGPPQDFGGGAGPDIVADVELVEDRFYVEGDYRVDHDAHDLLLSVGINHVDVSESRQALNLDPTTFLPSPEKNEFAPVVQDGGTRWNYALAVQDEWRVSDQLSVTTGARYDYYDDAGDALSPRVAAVYRIDRDTTLKAQYARAFRPPTLLEVGGQIDEINPVYSDSIEAALIVGRSGNRAAVTLFHHDIRDLIVFTSSGGSFGFDNVSKATSSGAELEWERRFNRFVAVDGNLSYTRPRDVSADADIADSARWLGNLGLRVSPNPDIDLHLQFDHVGERARARGDRRPSMPAETKVDLTVGWQADDTVLLQAGIRNLANSSIRDPAPTATYADDYPGSDRTFWLGIRVEPRD